MSVVSVMVSVYNMWFEYPELKLLFLMTYMCSLYVVLNILPFCPVYFNEKSRQFHLINAAFVVFICL
jgi:hypothetical protein